MNNDTSFIMYLIYVLYTDIGDKFYSNSNVNYIFDNEYKRGSMLQINVIQLIEIKHC